MNETRHAPGEDRPLRVAVVGAGPSGFHAAMALLGQTQIPVEVDLFDRLPTPYGLVRGGVAPDHPKIKTVVKVYERAASDPRFRFFGNVELGRAIGVDDLVEHYDQIVYAIGNENDRRMGIPGEHLVGCTPATVFVGWYNGHPDYAQARFDLSCGRVAVVGNGNVAADVTRILARDHAELTDTDIADHALAALRESRVQEVVVLGRRGPLQVAFAPPELRELTELSGVRVEVSPEDLELDEADQAELATLRPKDPRRLNYQILSQAALQSEPTAERSIRFRFRVSPREILAGEGGRIRALRLASNQLVRQGDGGCRAVETGETEDIEVGWVFVSIGYEGRRIPGVPFDGGRGVIANVDGRVIDPVTGEPVANQYCVGWAKSGPRGLIAMHRGASTEVVGRMLEDARRGSVQGPPRAGGSAMSSLLESRGVSYVTFRDWQVIDQAEVERGRQRGAPRSKFVRVSEMIDLVEMQRRGW